MNDEDVAEWLWILAIKVYADIRGGSLEMGRQTTGVIENVDFRASDATSSAS